MRWFLLESNFGHFFMKFQMPFNSSLTVHINKCIPVLQGVDQSPKSQSRNCKIMPFFTSTWDRLKFRAHFPLLSVFQSNNYRPEHKEHLDGFQIVVLDYSILKARKVSICVWQFCLQRFQFFKPSSVSLQSFPSLFPPQLVSIRRRINHNRRATAILG